MFDVLSKINVDVALICCLYYHVWPLSLKCKICFRSTKNDFALILILDIKTCNAALYVSMTAKARELPKE